MKEILKIKDPGAFASGIFLDLNSAQDALWRDAENVLFLHGRARPLHGRALLQTFVGNVLALRQGFVAPNARTYVGTATGLWKYENNVVSGLATETATQWSLVTWGNWVIGATGSKVLVSKNTNSSEVLTGAPSSAKILARLANHLVAFGTDSTGQQISWSSLSNPELWTPLPENTAGDLFLRDLDSEIRAAVELDNSLIVYSVDSAGALDYVGSPNYFGFRRTQSGIGAVGKDAVLNVENMHYGLCRKGFFRAQRNGFEFIHTPQLYKWLEQNIDWANAGSTVCWYDASSTHVFWTFPKVGGGRTGLGYNIRSGAWTRINVAVTAAASTELFSYALVGIGTELSAWDRSGLNLSWFLQSGSFDFGLADRYKRLSMLELRGEGQSGTTLLVQGADRTDADATQETLFSNAGQKDNWINRDAIVSKFRLSGSGPGLDLGGFMFWGELGGYR
jgi:hypothetical protein